jgi:hypothetical protein
MASGDRLEGRLDIGEGFDAVDLCRLDQRGDTAPGFAAFVMTCEECVLAIESQFPFILPMSGKSARSIIAGMPTSDRK